MKNKKLSFGLFIFLSVIYIILIINKAYALYLPYQSSEQSIRGSVEDKIWPLQKDVLTSCYGWRNLDSRGKNWHQGIDLEAKIGTNVFAVQDGTVYYTCDKENFNDIDKAKALMKEDASLNLQDAIAQVSKPCGGYGINILLQHADGSYTRYNHLSRIDVKKGQEVKTGDVIGLTGNTGNSEGPHLDLKVFYSTDFRPKVETFPFKNDPLNYLPRPDDYVVKYTASSCFNSPTMAELQKDVPITVDLGDITLVSQNEA